MEPYKGGLGDSLGCPYSRRAPEGEGISIRRATSKKVVPKNAI